MNDPLHVSRRYFLGQCTGISLGAMALSSLLGRAFAAPASGEPPIGLPGLPHFAPKAKRVIFLTQSGGPSQLELFDEKPELMKWAGIELPDSVRKGQRLTTMTANQKQLVMPARVKFSRCGQSGATIGEWLPHSGGGGRPLLHQVDAHRRDQSRPGDDVVSHRAPARRAGRASARGSATVSAARIATCRIFVVLDLAECSARATSRSTIITGAAVSCRRGTRA